MILWVPGKGHRPPYLGKSVPVSAKRSSKTRHFLDPRTPWIFYRFFNGFGLHFGIHFDPKYVPNVTKIVKQTNKNSIKKRRLFLIACLLDFAWFSIPKLEGNSCKNETHRCIEAKRPRAAKYCKYQYKLNVFWFSGIVFLMKIYRKFCSRT